jgi:hypothetical protein
MGCAADHSYTSRALVKNLQNCSSTAPYISVAGAPCTYLFVVHVMILQTFSAATASMRFHSAALHTAEDITAA